MARTHNMAKCSTAELPGCHTLGISAELRGCSGGAGCIFLANRAYVQASITWMLITPFLYKVSATASHVALRAFPDQRP